MRLFVRSWKVDSPLWVEGEIAQLTIASSGHMYFSLKDAGAQVRCALFRTRAVRLGWQPRQGDKVRARVQVTLYEARGEFQLTVETLVKGGLGHSTSNFSISKQPSKPKAFLIQNANSHCPAFQEPSASLPVRRLPPSRMY